MRLSAIVIARDEAQTIGATLRRLRRAGIAVLVVDGQSRDATAHVAAAHARVIRCAPGRGRQLSTGAKHAPPNSDTLLFVHADTWLPPDFAGAIERCLRDPTVVGGAFRRRFRQADLLLSCLAGVDNLRARLSGIYLGDQAIFVRRAVYEAAGGFPELPLFEDIAFSRAMRRFGRTRLLPLTVLTSARRFRKSGTLPTFGRMLALWCLYWLGASPQWLARRYGRAA